MRSTCRSASSLRSWTLLIQTSSSTEQITSKRSRSIRASIQRMVASGEPTRRLSSFDDCDLTVKGTGRPDSEGPESRSCGQSWVKSIVLAVLRGSYDVPGHPFAVWLSGSPAHNAVVKTETLPWDTPHNVSAHMTMAVTGINQVMRRNTLSATSRYDLAVGLAWKNVVIVRLRWQ